MISRILQGDSVIVRFASDLPTLLRLEATLAMMLAVVIYAHLHGSWVVFAACFLAPDLAFIGYLAGARIGAIAYNVTHSYVGPAIVAGSGLILAPALVPFAAIWAAHIGFDRMLGYGLK